MGSDCADDKFVRAARAARRKVLPSTTPAVAIGHQLGRPSGATPTHFQRFATSHFLFTLYSQSLVSTLKSMKPTTVCKYFSCTQYNIYYIYRQILSPVYIFCRYIISRYIYISYCHVLVTNKKYRTRHFSTSTLTSICPSVTVASSLFPSKSRVRSVVGACRVPLLT